MRRVGALEVRRGVLPFLIIGGPVVVEVAGRWVELAASLVVVAAAILCWRWWPLAVLSLAVVGALVPALVLAPTVTNPLRVWPFVACAVFGYLVGRWVGRPRTVLATLGAVLLAGLPVSLVVDAAARGGFGVLFGLYDWFVLVLVLLLVAGVPWLAGRYLLLREQLRAAAVERAAAGERTRIAREMHDSLGHEWSLIALRVAAFEVSPRLDDAARAQAGEIRAGVAAATERLHEIIGLLGEADDTDVDGLVRRARAAGQSIAVGELPEVPPAAARLLHRVVREALTNAAKHAPGRPVTVHFESTRDTTTVTVTNPLGGGRAVGGGSGLAALREVVRVDAGVRGDDFVLTAAVPHEQPARARQERPRLWRLVRVPLLAAAVVVVLAGGMYVMVGADNRLDDAAYRRLHIGQSQEDVEKVLPRFQILGDPDRLLPPLDGDCRNYWATVQTDARLFYRLCFVDGRLAVKETVPRSAVSR